MAFAFLSTSPPAHANPPSTSVTFDYRLDPMDSENPVVFTVTLHLTPASTSGNSVGWQITAAEFYQTGSERMWTGCATQWIIFGAHPFNVFELPEHIDTIFHIPVGYFDLPRGSDDRSWAGRWNIL